MKESVDTPKKTIKISCKGAAVMNLEALLPFQGKLKALSRLNAAKLRKEILELGFSEPVGVWIAGDKIRILSGHQRVQVLNSMRDDGYAIPPIPVNIIEAADEKEAKRKILALTSSYGTMQMDGLLELATEAELDLSGIDGSFTFPELAKEIKLELARAGKDGLIDDDAVPEAPATPLAKRGEIYQLGEHRLMCGDATSEKDVTELTDGKKANMIFTDPPYGVSYSGGIQFKAGKAIRGARSEMKNDERDLSGKIIPIMAKICSGPVYVWFASLKAKGLYNAVDACGEMRAVIIWAKRGGYASMNAHYKQKHEMCLYWKPHGSDLKWNGKTTENTVWEVQKDGVNKHHPTQKPVALALRAMSNHDADTVLDLFGGSGSTLIACEKLGRSCGMMEIDPVYVDVTIKRWEEYTGKKAKKLN